MRRLASSKVRDELDEMLQLVNSNATSRELTDYEKMKQIEMLKKIYAEMRERGYPITGRQRDFISQELNISSGSVHEMENISSNAAPEVVELYKDEKISTHLASEVARQPEDIQREFAAAEEQTAASLREIQERHKPKKKEKTDADYGETVIQRKLAEDIAAAALELADVFSDEQIVVYGKAGKDTDKRLKQALKNLKSVLEFVKISY